MHKEHPLPVAASNNNMTVVPLVTGLPAGPDKEATKLFEGPRRRLVQITLRNGAVLAAHKAAVPITIHCVAGGGRLMLGDSGESMELAPGVLVTLEPNVVHEVKGQPAVSILLTQFTDQ